jgi:hypothetical protein
MIKADKKRGDLRAGHHLMDKLQSQGETDFIRLLSTLIRGKCSFSNDWNYMYDNPGR